MIESETIKSGNFVYDLRDISPAQLNVTSRQINYWIEKAIVPFVERQQKVEATDKFETALIDNQPLVKTKWIRLNLAKSVCVSIVK